MFLQSLNVYFNTYKNEYDLHKVKWGKMPLKSSNNCLKLQSKWNPNRETKPRHFERALAAEKRSARYIRCRWQIRKVAKSKGNCYCCVCMDAFSFLKIWDVWLGAFFFLPFLFFGKFSIIQPFNNLKSQDICLGDVLIFWQGLKHCDFWHNVEMKSLMLDSCWLHRMLFFFSSPPPPFSVMFTTHNRNVHHFEE